ncbi:MAG TPA: 23S rRNA (uracil(1939)-C(5))-methyltransferase RlmD [Terriglobales bacterium]|nr:23S rRNA (uracil(1939)-C(5))-methyltransferase RlmD [Terriglobales bacterium]
MRLTIDKLVYGGEGLARVGEAEGRAKTIFVPFVLPGEEVEAQLVEQKKSFAHARLESVVTASPERQAPPCPYFLRCGGCHYQHIDHPRQVEAKKVILLETLRRTGKIDWTKPIEAITGEPFHYRNRTRMRIHHTGRFEIGYYQYRSHKMIAVRECPISSPLINRILALLWTLGEAGELPPAIREVEYFADATDEKALLELVLQAPPSAEDKQRLSTFATRLMQEQPAVVGIAGFIQQGDAADYGDPVWTQGEKSLEYQTKTDRYRVSAGSFFQTNRFLSDALVGLVTAGKEGGLALDLYAGTGLFALPLARAFDQVIAVEASPASFADLRVNATSNIKAVKSTTEEYLRQHSGKHAPDLVVMDPPRAGLGEKVIPNLERSKAAELCYVSCDPATLARDLKALVEAGYGIDSIHLVDLFPQTFHLETVVQLSR